MAKSPTERTLDECRKRRWRAGVVEKWLPPRGDMPHGRRVDLFGCIDLIAIAPRAVGTLAIQATSGSNVSSRVRKSVEECGDFMRAWLDAGNSFEVWGWTKRKRRKDGRLWYLRRVAIVLRRGDLLDVPVPLQSNPAT